MCSSRYLKKAKNRKNCPSPLLIHISFHNKLLSTSLSSASKLKFSRTILSFASCLSRRLRPCWQYYRILYTFLSISFTVDLSVSSFRLNLCSALTPYSVQIIIFPAFPIFLLHLSSLVCTTGRDRRLFVYFMDVMLHVYTKQTCDMRHIIYSSRRPPKTHSVGSSCCLHSLRHETPWLSQAFEAKPGARCSKRLYRHARLYWWLKPRRTTGNPKWTALTHLICESLMLKLSRLREQGRQGTTCTRLPARPSSLN